MHVLFACSELAPLAQSGGLGDATSGLARALGALGHRVTVFLPGYRRAQHGGPSLHWVDAGGLDVGFPGFTVNGRVRCTELFPNVEVCLWDAPALFDRAGLYGEAGADYGDNALRFIAFSRAAAYRAAAVLPDVVVAHDWHAGLTLAALRTSLDRGRGRGIGTVQVVHNNAHQGRVPLAAFPWTNLAPDLLHPDGVEAWGTLCLLKAGVQWADRTVAVSPTYAREIQTSGFGEGLEGLYREKRARLLGIVNGIDAQRFDPSTDRALPATYSAADLTGKHACRSHLLARTGLNTPPGGLLVAAIGRLAAQKGWDVLANSVEALLERDASVVLLGDGAPDIAAQLRALAARFPARVFFAEAFDEQLSRQIYAGADAMLVPSRFEPCGLVQLIAQRYGTLPIAHATGGLVDTIHDPLAGPVRAVTDAADPWRRATGVLFSPLEPGALVHAVDRVARLAAAGRLPELQARLLALDVSWDGPAQSWAAVLAEVRAAGRARL